MTPAKRPDPQPQCTPRGERSDAVTRAGLSSERSESARTPPTSTASSVLVFFDYACVFCYTDWFRFDHLAEHYEVEVTPIPFELRPSIPPEGVSAAEHGLGHSPRVDEYLTKQARREGFPLCFTDLVPNTHLAMVLGEVARDAGRETHLKAHRAIFSAYYGRGEDIGDTEVLLRVAGESGLPRETVEAAWEDGAYEARLESFHSFAHALGVTMTPAALVCNELLIGTHPYRRIADAAERCLVKAGAGS